MTRTITAGMQTQVAAQTGTTAHLISLEFSGGTAYLVTLAHDVSWDGETWVGIGGRLGFADVEERADLRAAGVEIVLSGVDQTVIAALLGQSYRGRDAVVYRAKFASDGTIVADPLEVFSGLLNSGFSIQERVSDEGREGDVEVRARCVSDVAVLSMSRGIRTNLASHQAVENGDTFFQHVNALPDVINWGTNRSTYVRRGNSPPGGPSGPGGLGWH